MTHISEKFLTIDELSAELGIPVRSIRTLKQKRKIPFVKLGHRTLLFNPAKVSAALSKFEVRASGLN